MHLATRSIILALSVVTGALALVCAPRPASAASELTGRWSGVFEFVVIGKRAAFGPAATLDAKRRAEDDRAPTFGEGDLELVIENQFDEHFFGRWTAGGQRGDIVCTMMDTTRFMCRGKKSSVLGSVTGEHTLRMCWGASGDNATTGCADLERPH